MEILFLGSMLVIIIETNLDRNLFLKTCTPDYITTVYLAQRYHPEPVLPG